MQPGESRKTTDHQTIREWTEARGGKPASVKGTANPGEPVGELRLMFPDAPYARNENLEPVSWDDWFEKFDRDKLALVHQDQTTEGEISSFSKVVARD
ncbi:MAG: hypothetical protein ACLFV3_00285 [Phycisphaeraceae bacterium]